MFVMSLRYFSSSLAFVHVTPTEYNGAHLPPLGRFPMLDISTLEMWNSVGAKRFDVLETSRRDFSGDVSFGIGTLLVVEHSSLEKHPRACVSYTPQYADTVLILLIANVPLGAMILRA